LPGAYQEAVLSHLLLRSWLSLTENILFYILYTFPLYSIFTLILPGQ